MNHKLYQNSKKMNNEAALSLREIKKFDFIDALRGWAFLGVLLVHVGQHIQPASSWIARLARNGQYGVQLFFVLSAFTLFFSLYIRKKDEKNILCDFFIRRFFRIAPMFWTAAFFYLALGGFKQLYSAPHEVTVWRILSTFLFMHGWHPNTINNVVPGGWTIAVEMNFYLLLPLFFKCTSSLKKAIIVLCSLLVVRVAANYFYMNFLMPSDCSLWLSKDFLYYWLPNQLPVFSFGFILFSLIRDRLEKAVPCGHAAAQKKEKGLAWGLLVLFAASLFLSKFIDPYGTFLPRPIFLGLSFLLLTWALAIHPFSFFVNRFMNFLGKVSYSAYLVHFYVIDIIAERIPPPSHSDSSFLFFFLLALAGALGLSTMTYAWIEQPFQRLGKKLIRKYL